MSNTAAAPAADAGATTGATVPAATRPAGDQPATYAQQAQPHNSSQPQPQPPKMPGCVWTNEAVTLLLSLYLREQQLARPQKLKKKDVWRGICAELWRRGLACSWQECDKKYRNLKQTFVRNLKQAGKKECRWMFFPLMLEINRHEPFVGDVMLTAGRTGSGGHGAGTAETAVGEPLGRQQQHYDDLAAAEAESDDKRNEDDLLVGALYTPAPSPTAMNLSQRPQQRTPSPPMLPSTADYSGPAPAKRPRRDNHYDQQQQHHHNGLTANGTANGPPTIIKTESPTLILPVQQQHLHHLHHHNHQTFPHIPANHNNTAVKLSPSPVPTALPPSQPPDQRRQSSDQPPVFDRALGPLDIRLLHAAIPFVTHNFIPAHQPMQLQHLQAALPPPSGPAVKTVPTSPSTMVSTEDDDDDDDNGDGDHENDDHKHGEEPKPSADGDCGLHVDEEETRSMPDLPLDGNSADQQQHQQQTPPKWFNLFMAEFRRHEQRKLQQIAELCAEVRRTNDIEQQRNHILSEKNEIMRHMNAYMVNK